MVDFRGEASSVTDACSRALWNSNGKAIVTGRSMDWAHKFDDYLFVVPRGITMDGGTGTRSAEWTSKYGSVVSSISGYVPKYGFDFVKDGGTDGINEKGLGVHLLYLEETKYPAVDQRRPQQRCQETFVFYWARKTFKFGQRSRDQPRAVIWALS